MAESISAALAELEAHILAVWPEKDLTLYDEQTRRINWRLLLEDGTIDVPFCVIALGAAIPAEGYGLRTQDYNLPVAIYYIRSSNPTAAETTANEKVMQDVLDHCQLLADYLHHDTGLNMVKMQVFDEPMIDVSPANPANAVFVEASAPYIAGSLSFNMHIGTVIS
jgi:hypothetical protein